MFNEMYGYQLSANALKHYLETENIKDEAVERQIKALEIMANTDRETQYAMFNSSAFNDIVKGYVLMALDRVGVNDDVRADVMYEIRRLFDEVTAEKAEHYYSD